MEFSFHGAIIRHTVVIIAAGLEKLLNNILNIWHPNEPNRLLLSLLLLQKQKNDNIFYFLVALLHSSRHTITFLCAALVTF